VRKAVHELDDERAEMSRSRQPACPNRDPVSNIFSWTARTMQQEQMGRARAVSEFVACA